MQYRSPFRVDSKSGLVVPAFDPEERRSLRARAMALLQIALEGKLDAAGQAELIKIDADLYGPGSGWLGDPRAGKHAEMLSRQLLHGLKRRGLITTEDVVLGGGTGGEWVDGLKWAGR